MQTLTFAAGVDAFVKKTRQRMEAVQKLATENAVEEVILRTPRVTGFLAASLTGSLDGPLPIRPDAVPVAGQTYEPSAYALVIEAAELGQTTWFSFVAAYSLAVEFGTKYQNPAAMVRLSAQNWPFHVEAAVRAAKAAVASRSPQ